MVNNQRLAVNLGEGGYVTYPDEDLSSRLSEVSLKNGILRMRIDGLPWSTPIHSEAEKDHECGALPLNVLANRILQKHDAAQLRIEGMFSEALIEQGHSIGVSRSLII